MKERNFIAHDIFHTLCPGSPGRLRATATRLGYGRIVMRISDLHESILRGRIAMVELIEER